MRILYLITSTDRGGAERQLQWLAAAMRDRGHHVRVVSMLPIGVVGEAMRADGIEVISLAMVRGRPSWQALRALRAAVGAWRPDLVHAHMLHANLLARVVVGRRRHPPLICTIHSHDEGGGWRARAYRWTDRWCRTTTHVSETGLRRYRALGLVDASRSRWVPNALSTSTGERPAAADSDTPFRWVAVGRLEPVKGIDRLLPVVAMLRHESPMTLTLVGDGSARADLERQVDALGLRDMVTFAGDQENVIPWLHAADGFVSASRMEGLPLALLEAGAAGLPVVATDVGGVRDVMGDPPVDGLVSESEAALAEGMRQVMRSTPAARADRGMALRTRVLEVFGPERVASQWDALYRGMVGG